VDILTSWVKPPNAIGGLDHLAVQAPCISLYGKMLPGITNVTDRARYYSFYPWVVWSLEKRGHTYGDTFIDLFRKADCLFTLIAERHAKVAGGDRDDHAAATVGSGNMAGPVASIREGHSVTLSEYACREGKTRYFKNKLGGLGQYYLGVFRELGMMTGDLQNGIKNIREVGGSVADCVDQHVDGELFFKTIAEDTVSAARLDDLHAFCPCALKTSAAEHRKLTEMFFGHGSFSGPNALARRRTLKTILHLADQLAAGGVAIDLEQFRGCSYSGALPDQSSWRLPAHLETTRRQWAIYQRNELLSLAVQGIFYAMLHAYQESTERFHAVDALAQWFLVTPEVEQMNAVFPLQNSVATLATAANDWLAPLEDWNNQNHEVFLAGRIAFLCGSREDGVTKRSAILEACLKVLLALQSRPETREGYGPFVFPPNYLSAYPINLQTFNQHSLTSWSNLTARQWLGWLATSWGVNTHLMVALRKLRGQSQSTFRIRPSDQGLEIISVPEAVFTSPRFRQALRILKDIGALEKQDRVWSVSAIGRQFMESADD
jgi:hypothetical protein